MFGDDPDPTVATARVRFGTTAGRTREGFDALMQGGAQEGLVVTV